MTSSRTEELRSERLQSRFLLQLATAAVSLACAAALLAYLTFRAAGSTTAVTILLGSFVFWFAAYHFTVALRSVFRHLGASRTPTRAVGHEDGRRCHVHVEDLLGRAPVQLAMPGLPLALEQRAVLITGGAGSIGSELARQIAAHRPKELILFDHDETQLFYLEMELHERHPDVRVVAVVGDINDHGAIERVFRRHNPNTVFHAAAYKHVPMMETNAREAIRNNLIGTYAVASVSAQYAAEKFVLMSTDKAVRPCSVMGATKRLAELAVLELQQMYPRTAFCAVRFGNVLGSRGSVLPIFEKRLASGQPLAVTHPEVTRYFMTTPEAVQLILQASLLPDIHGRLVMLEMGEPVRILELAQNFLRLAGNADPDRIVFTGLRRGERLHEELIAPNEVTVSTPIPKVKLVITPRTTNGEMADLVALWNWQLEAGDEADVLQQLWRRFPSLSLPAGGARRASAIVRGGNMRRLAMTRVAAVRPDPDAT